MSVGLSDKTSHGHSPSEYNACGQNPYVSVKYYGTDTLKDELADGAHCANSGTVRATGKMAARKEDNVSFRCLTHQTHQLRVL